jgi:glycosyltransferase involved in cell wall biosynthesis
MKFVHLIAGAGPMYCGSCMHGNTLAAALRKAGADVIAAPLYTVLRTDEENVSIDRLAMGGINLFLDERLPLWRRMPAFVRRVLDRPSLVAWLAGRGTQTRPEQLGRLTLAMLGGQQGPLKADVEQLVAWLKTEERPDLVHLSNVMLAGLARPLRQELGVPVVATLSGEDAFLEKLPPPYRQQTKAALRASAADLAAAVAMSGSYADFMAEYLSLPRQRIEVIRPGLNLDGRGRQANPSREASPADATTPKTVGFFSRICAEKGLHLLVEAMCAMDKAGQGKAFRLRAAGYMDRQDQPYLDAVRRRLDAAGLTDRFEYAGELSRADKILFLQSIDLLCLPSVIRESKGLPVLEAWASGIPVVLPDHGTFSELVAETGGGLLYGAGDEGALADALARMLNDDALAAECGRRGQAAVQERYTAEREARETLALYRRLCNR